MRMKRKNILCAFAITVLLIGGCGQQQSQMKYIGAETAKQVALEASGLSSSEAESVIADLTSKNGTDYYQVDLTVSGQNYRYDIDALTGVVIDSRIPDAAPKEPQAASAEVSAVSVSDASAKANTQTEPHPSGSDAKSDSGNETRTDSSANPVAGTEMITADAAKSYALAHAGLTDDQVTFSKSKLDYDDGKQVYDVEFYTGNREEYDYEIDAYTGAVISYDYETKNNFSSANSSAITEEDAKALALAQVPGAASSDIQKFKTDYDDGRMEYEGTIVYDGMKYEFEIDAYSGAIRSWEAEPARR